MAIAPELLLSLVLCQHDLFTAARGVRQQKSLAGRQGFSCKEWTCRADIRWQESSAKMGGCGGLHPHWVYLTGFFMV
jgi:hypothetical protein